MSKVAGRAASSPRVYELGGRGPTLLLAHATGLHGRVWGPMVERLREDFQCWAFDFRGHGDSPPLTTADQTWTGFAQDVVEVVEAHGLSNGYAFGHSLGGAVLAQAVLQLGVKFKAMYVYEPGVLAADRPAGLAESFVAAAARRRASFASKTEALTSYATKPPMSRWDPAVLADYVEYGFRGVDAAQGDGVTLKCTPEAESWTFATGLAEEEVLAMGSFNFPVIMARGSQSTVVSMDQGARLAGGLGTGRYEQLEGLDHWGPLEEPSRVAEHVRTGFIGAKKSHLSKEKEDGQEH